MMRLKGRRRRRLLTTLRRKRSKRRWKKTTTQGKSVILAKASGVLEPSRGGSEQPNRVDKANQYKAKNTSASGKVFNPITPVSSFLATEGDQFSQGALLLNLH